MTKDLEQSTAEEVRPLDADFEDPSQLPHVSHPPEPRPEWWGPEQDRAMTSRALCICGHQESEHCVPKDDDDRECMPAIRWDAEERDDWGYCPCQHFHPAA